MAGTTDQTGLVGQGPGFSASRSPLLTAAATFGTLASQLQDGLPRWEEAAEAGAKAVGDGDAVAKYQTDVLQPLMEVVKAINGSVHDFSRALSQTVVSYVDADSLSAEQFAALTSMPDG